MGLVEDLHEFLEVNQVSTNRSILEQHSKDESYHTPALPDVVVFPETREDVVSLITYAKNHLVPVVPFGSGSSLEGHTIPVKKGISLDMTRMNRILEVRPEDFIVCVEPGMTRIELNQFLRRYGMFFPVDPGANATLGGMTATNASGTTTVRYGAMRDNVRKLEVVLPSGKAIEVGSLAAKSSSGYHLTGLFVGSEGTLGVITKIWLRIYGIPERTIAVRAEFPDIASCVRTSTAIVSLGVPVARIDFVEGAMMGAVNAYNGTNYTKTPTLFIELSGSAKSVEYDAAMTREMAMEEGCTCFEFEREEEKRNLLWKARHNVAYAFEHQYPGSGLMSTDVCVPLSKLPEAVTWSRARLDELHLRGAMVGHVGDGNFHTTLAVSIDDVDEMARVTQYNEDLVKRALALGGTCTGEHGVGIGKMKYQEMEHGEAIELMRHMKQMIDPLFIMNPGKLVDGEYQ